MYIMRIKSLKAKNRRGEIERKKGGGGREICAKLEQ